MRQRILLLIFVLFCSGLSAQTNFVIDLEVGFLRYKSDSVHFNKPRTFSVNTTGCTEIFSLGKSARYEFGMRIEILATKLTGTEKFLVGKIYYIKKGNDWLEVLRIEHSEWQVRSLAQRESTDMFIMGGASLDSPAFDVRLNENYYR